jgi:hypothetical protein
VDERAHERNGREHGEDDCDPRPHGHDPILPRVSFT